MLFSLRPKLLKALFQFIHVKYYLLQFALTYSLSRRASNLISFTNLNKFPIFHASHIETEFAKQSYFESLRAMKDFVLLIKFI
jgi:hypothetical protein